MSSYSSHSGLDNIYMIDFIDSNFVLQPLLSVRTKIENGMSVRQYSRDYSCSKYFNVGTLAEEFNLEETIEVIEDVKNNDESNITSGPILGLELEGQEASNYPLLAQPIELSVGTRFSSWIIAEHYLKEYGRQKGFVVNRYRVEYSKSSADPNNRIVKKRTFACENAGRYKPNKTRPIEQQRNKGSKKTNCKWHINLSKPESLPLHFGNLIMR
uniref:FAR1 domain-containing protein n=1 Tax=Rhizophagus irregularis (strain DAOM 181602 / DAOM 197198 / MUCL 43194) TaxID=747089 RepID=U9U1U9_RHIID